MPGPSQATCPSLQIAIRWSLRGRGIVAIRTLLQSSHLYDYNKGLYLNSHSTILQTLYVTILVEMMMMELQWRYDTQSLPISATAILQRMAFVSVVTCRFHMAWHLWTPSASWHSSHQSCLARGDGSPLWMGICNLIPVLHYIGYRGALHMFFSGATEPATILGQPTIKLGL